MTDAFEAVTARVSQLRAGYTPPDFAHVPDPDAAIFLCATDHGTGYERAHRVGRRGPFTGSERQRADVGGRLGRGGGAPGLLRAASLRGVRGPELAELFRVDDETVGDPERRAELWRDLAERLLAEHGGEASALLASCGSRLGGPGGLLECLARFEAYADPLAKKAQLYAKICERRGWFDVDDPESWEVAADNVLMRLALRSGLVERGSLAEVRGATRVAFKRVAEAASIPPPVLDDLLWEVGRDDPDLLGALAGDLREPPREPGSTWY